MTVKYEWTSCVMFGTDNKDFASGYLSQDVTLDFGPSVIIEDVWLNIHDPGMTLACSVVLLALRPLDH